MSAKTKYDVAVIGGGPAGASSALYAAKLGLKTILFEKQKYPRNKPCGGALTARCLPLLGKHAADAINSNIEEIRLFAPSFKCFARRKVPGHFIRREEFDQAMAKDAQEAGAHILDNCRVKIFNPLPSGDYEIVTNSYQETIIAKYIILATGFKKNAPGKSLVIRENF
jgi:flavin-dependent dehydrogenase